MTIIEYQPGKILGKGGSGEIRELDGTNNKLVVKMVDAVVKHRIMNEYKIYRILEGITVVPRVESLEKRGDQFAMVMEYAGVDVKEYLFSGFGSREAKLHQANVARLAAKMITAMREIHSKDVIHGDIHPGNFLIQQLGSDVAIRVIDFEAARVVGDPFDAENEEIPINYRFSCPKRTETPSNGPSIADDLVSLAYTVAFLASGDLLWGDLVLPSGQPSDLEGLVELKQFCGAGFFSVILPMVFHDFLFYALDLEDSATAQEVDYDTHVRTFEDFAKGRD